LNAQVNIVEVAIAKRVAHGRNAGRNKRAISAGVSGILIQVAALTAR
jgi:hypothetical protein